MQLIIKKFNELTVLELYKILKARVDVFVVEQKCAYGEIDGKDADAYHIFYTDENGEIAAYLRLFPKPDDRNTAQIGRVLTVKRGKGLGEKLMNSAVDFAKKTLRATSLYCEAQTYAVGFYQKVGLQVSSEEFLEDGIPHVKMTCKI